MNKSIHQLHGLTLVEVIVTVAIIGIVAAVAWPTYSDLQQRNRRVEGRTAVLLAQAYMEKCFTRYRDYSNSNCDLPTALTASAALNYNIGFATSSRTANAYTLEAKIKSGGLQESDTDCATISISNTGDKSGSTNTFCWPN